MTNNHETAAAAGMEYLKRLPDRVPDDGRVLVHNDVWPAARRPGTRGSRAWLQLPADNLKPCDCGWASELGPHFCTDRGIGRRPGLASTK